MSPDSFVTYLPDRSVTEYGHQPKEEPRHKAYAAEYETVNIDRPNHRKDNTHREQAHEQTTKAHLPPSQPMLSPKQDKQREAEYGRRCIRGHATASCV